MPRNIDAVAEAHWDREWELQCEAEEAEMSVGELLAVRRKAKEEARLERYLSSLDD